jgi:hypothetical protein
MLKRNRSLLLLWALGLLTLNLLVATLSRQQVSDQIVEYLGAYLRITLDESLFGSDQGVVNDRSSILSAGTALNDAIEHIVDDRWYSALNDCRVAVDAIDDIILPGRAGSGQQLSIDLQRNAIARPVLLSFDCAHRVEAHLFWSGLLGLLFLLLFKALPVPLSRSQLHCMDALLAQGYSRTLARHYATAHELDTERLDFRQRACLEALHRPEEGNYEFAFRIASMPELSTFTPDQQRWLLLSLAHACEDTEKALAVALHPDRMEIDLRRGKLEIHGMDIPMHKTPLFYLAWYAIKRRSSDGWVQNPRSNRPDRIASEELVALMADHNGHGRAMHDLEAHGLKAKTLDQNRSKIKDGITAVLGEELGARYLFELRKHATSNRTSYRLKLDAGRIRIESV